MGPIFSRVLKVLIPQRRGSLEPSPRGFFWFEYSLSLYVIGQILFGFPLGTRLTYSVVGGWWVGRILAYLAKGVLFTMT